ncbi:MAG TPA: ribosomal L7Ae/L30e/S12e/Gadd45 family protein [Halanaerobiales bacterium]|nr:ribosomal L7Ae/L30e/S12e/Gadd45 family protein [Halanaerobiales bacterium]
MVDLRHKRKVVGSKETLQAIKKGKADCVFIAKDSDTKLKNEILNEAKNSNINIKEIDSKMQLGRVCGIEVAAASAALLK